LALLPRNTPAPLTPFMIISVAEEMNPTKRASMEDVHRITPHFDGQQAQTYIAVYDGHGGRGIVDFLETKLEANIALEMKVDPVKVCVPASRADRTNPINQQSTCSAHLTSPSAPAARAVAPHLQDPLRNRARVPHHRHAVPRRRDHVQRRHRRHLPRELVH